MILSGSLVERKGARVCVGLGKEAIVGCPERGDRLEDAALEPPFELGKEAFDGIDQRCRHLYEVEGEGPAAVSMTMYAHALKAVAIDQDGGSSWSSRVT
jgi:hypothetical protein